MNKPISAHFCPKGNCEQFGEGRKRIKTRKAKKKEEAAQAEAALPGNEVALGARGENADVLAEDESQQVQAAFERRFDADAQHRVGGVNRW